MCVCTVQGKTQRRKKRNPSAEKSSFESRRKFFLFDYIIILWYGLKKETQYIAPICNSIFPSKLYRACVCRWEGETGVIEVIEFRLN